MTNENCCTSVSNTNTDFKSVQFQNDSNCGCDSECCDNTQDYQDENQIKEIEPTDVNITIDGKSILVSDKSKNLVEIAKEAGISIPAPCFLAKKKNGCCNACVVEVNSKQSFACGTKPKDGMDIVVNRADLVSLRKERLLKYKDGMKNGTLQKCRRS